MIETNFSSTVEYYFIIALIIFLSSLRSVKGRKYKPTRVFIRPILYLLLGILVIVGDPVILPLLIVAIILGIYLGMRFGLGTKFFIKGGILYYKRPIILYIIWLSLFVLRLFIGIAFPYNVEGIKITDILLMISAGILLGESYRIIKIANSIKRDY
ncbi:DUF1453 family protein [Acidianus sulfidivorans JP7]|uniref:DUF1453 domain-containing protein n=1 Tax=Acidianus sulfidivorans JP7 TaxID=619593 RepID=A0A2U9ILV7_9CREN|nr:CcdC protein domain-containing protein [Acidianus sulfidivorans]AWR97002.1 DUF1453 family protein [Acidianus sulfidivorans JP7]